MIYSAFKLLYYVRKQGVAVYPFDPQPKQTSLYEVYPSYTWSRFGLKRAAPLPELAQRMTAAGGLSLQFETEVASLPQDGKDAVVACVAMARMVAVQDNWAEKPAWCSEAEWLGRKMEGLILPYV